MRAVPRRAILCPVFNGRWPMALHKLKRGESDGR